MTESTDRMVSAGLAWPGLLVCLLTLVLAGAGRLRAAQNDAADPWLVPAAAREVKNPVSATPEGLAVGQRLFELNCASCHGSTGDGNGPTVTVLARKPADFTDAKTMGEASDGELFWKLSNGRPPMPPWKDLLSETERWELVNYLRTFASKAAGSNGVAGTSKTSEEGKD